MKNKYLHVVLMLFVCSLFFAQNNTGIGTTTPNASSILDVTSSTSGFLPPRMTQAQMNAIASPAEGLMVYCSDCSPIGLRSYDGTRFVSYSKLIGTVGAITCGSIQSTAIYLDENTEKFMVSIPYTGGNGGLHGTVVANSTGVTGLSVIAPNGFFAVGNGTLNLKVALTNVTSYGTANFSVTFGGQTCAFSLTVRPGTITTTTGRVWMDRNLGASRQATSSTDSQAYGDLYQWGRNINGHEKRTSSTLVGPVTIGSEPNGGKFILNSVDGDWLTPSNDLLWNSGTETAPVKTVYDPCPDGFRVPTETEWQAEIDAGIIVTPTDPLAALNLTYARTRNGTNGNINNTTVRGRYYSSTSTPTALARTLNVEPGVVNFAYINRRTGQSIRCIQIL